MIRRLSLTVIVLALICALITGCSVVPVEAGDPAPSSSVAELTAEAVTTSVQETTATETAATTTEAMFETTVETTAAPTLAPTVTPSPTPKPTPKPTPRPTVTPIPSPYYLYAEMGSFTLAVYSRDASGKYTQLVRLIRMAIGRGTMTRPGKYTLSTRLRWKAFSSSIYAQYGFQYRNGLYIHSPTYATKDITTMYDNSYNEIGTKATSGCLRIPTADAYWIYNNCPAGTILEIVSGSPRGLVPPSLIPIRISGQDPTDPGIVVPTPIETTEPSSAPTETEATTEPSATTTEPEATTGPSATTTEPEVTTEPSAATTEPEATTEPSVPAT